MRVALFSDVPQGSDACIYPESGKVKIGGPGIVLRMRTGPEVEYWDGEQ